MKATATLTFLSTEVECVTLALSQITARLPSQSVISGLSGGVSFMQRPAGTWVCHLLSGGNNCYEIAWWKDSCKWLIWNQWRGFLFYIYTPNSLLPRPAGYFFSSSSNAVTLKTCLWVLQPHDRNHVQISHTTNTNTTHTPNHHCIRHYYDQRYGTVWNLLRT